MRDYLLSTKLRPKWLMDGCWKDFGTPPAVGVDGLSSEGMVDAAWTAAHAKDGAGAGGDDAARKQLLMEAAARNVLWVDRAKKMKNEAKTADEKVAATKAYESAMDKRRQANKAKQAEAHKFKNPPDEDAIDGNVPAEAVKRSRDDETIEHAEKCARTT